MFAQRLAVQLDIRHQAGRLEPQKIAFARFHGDRQFAPIPTRPAKIGFPGLGVLPAPIVRQRYRLPVVVVQAGRFRAGNIRKLEPPIRVQPLIVARVNANATNESNSEANGQAEK